MVRRSWGSLLFLLCLSSLQALSWASAAEGAGEEEGEESVDPINLTVALMLLGTIALLMAVFYLVNHPDKHMQNYTCQILSSIISIFCSVLLFNNFQSIVLWLIEGSGLPTKLAANGIHFLCWLVLLQAAIYYASGAAQDSSSEDFIPPSPWMLKLHYKPAHAASVVLAHTTGFASINVWATIQQLPFFAATSLRAFSVVLPAFASLLLIHQLTASWREWKSLADDGTKDGFENMWDSEVEEAEDDVVGLTISFLFIQAARFWICGVLPNKAGVIHGVPSHAQCLALMGFVLVGGFGLFCLNRLRNKHSTTFPEKTTAKERFVSALYVVTSMIVAWAMMAAFRGEISRMQIATMSKGMVDSVKISLIVSGVSFLLIFCLDKLAHLENTGGEFELEKAIIAVILSFSMTVGFSWEKCFDLALETIAEGYLPKGPPQQWGQFGMTLVLLAIILPAWKRYIFPIALKIADKTLESEKHCKEVAEGRLTSELPPVVMRASPIKHRSSSQSSPESRPLLSL